MSLLSNIKSYLVNKVNLEAWENATIVFLGDYVDRGKYAKELIEFFSTTIHQEKPPGQSIYFILGNHDFALMSFLDIVPRPTPEENPTAYDLSYFIEKGEELWKPKGKKDKKYMKKHLMLSQGYRYPHIFHCKNTFKSYGVSTYKRVKLMKAFPEHHKDFYRSLDWIRILNIPNRGYAICVHSGMLTDQSVISQIEDLNAKKLYERIHQTTYREEVVPIPSELQYDDICLISGHHSFVSIKPSRLIIDSCGGKDYRPLCAAVFPPSETQLNTFLDGHVIIESSV